MQFSEAAVKPRNEPEMGAQADDLDYAIRQKDLNEATKALAITKSSLDSALGSVL